MSTWKYPPRKARSLPHAWFWLTLGAIALMLIVAASGHIATKGVMNAAHEVYAAQVAKRGQ